jgi:hypothetical protein
MRHTHRSLERIGSWQRIRSWHRIGLAGVLAGLALACGGESESGRGGTDPAAPAARAQGSSTILDPTDQARLEALYEWSSGAGQARDLATDTRSCMSQVTAAGLPGVAEHIQCMRNLGWQTIQPQG